MKHGSLIAPDEGSFGFGAHTSATVETISTHADAAEFITVPDAHLLFSGEFKHSGNDLKIVGDDGKSFLVTDYFKTDKHPTLRSPDGATLNGDLVDLLAGPLAPGQYAQAGAPQASTAEAVGRVAVVTGNVTIIRNGVTVTVNAGDVILKNDVVQTGAGATCGLSLNDGSTFNLTGGARLAINEFVYDPNGTANASLTTLIQGAATFVAGQIAKTGDMKVATPVATMGIRGTAVILDANSVDGRVTISVVDERDNKDHNVEVFDRNGNLIATVVSNGGRLFLTPTATFEVIASFTNKTAEQIAAEFAAFQAVLSTYDAAKQWFPNLPDRADLNPKGTQHAEGSGTPPPAEKSASLPDSVAQGLKLSDVVFTKAVESPGSGDGDTGPDDGTPTIIEQTFTPPALNQIFGSGAINGTDGADYITGSGGIDTINAMGGNDFVYAFGGDDIIIAGHGEGDDYYDGGAGSDDTIRFWSALADQPLTFHLGGFGDPNTVEGSITGVGSDIFTNIERIESGAGDDVFYIYGNTNWHIDAGDGIDTVALVGDLDITEQTEGPDISHLEIIDLNTTGSNTIDFDAEGAFDSIEDNDTGYLQIKGTSADRVNLTNDGQNYQGGVWRLADEGELTELGGVQYVHYVFNDGDAEASVYIQAGIVVEGVYADTAVEDRFNSQAYNLNDGSNDWATNWTEANDDFSGALNGPTDGEIFISHDPTTSSGNFQLTLTDKDAESDGADTIQRSADLTGATSATLTFDYRRVDMENDDAIQIYASDGESFVLIGEIEGNGLDDQAYQTFTFDLTPFISANTTIQFAVDDRLEDGDTLYIDNVKIAYLADKNEAPVIHTDEAYTAGDDFSTTLAGLSIADTDAGDDPNFGVSFQAEHGLLRFVDEEAPFSDYISSSNTLENINYKIGNSGGIVYVAPEEANPEVNLIDMVTMTADDGHVGGTDTVNFIFNAVGPGGVSMTGTAGKDVLFATGGNDTLEGGDGADTFVFDHNVNDQGGIGHDTVSDFRWGVDKIDLGLGFETYDLPMTEFGTLDFNVWVNTPGAFETVTHGTESMADDDTIIHLSPDEDITLKSVQMAQLSAGDFIIHPGTA